MSRLEESDCVWLTQGRVGGVLNLRYNYLGWNYSKFFNSYWKVWRCSPMMTDPHYLNPPCQHSLITLELHWCARHTNAIFPGPALVSTAGEYVQHWTFITSSVTLTPRLLHFFRLLWKFLHNPPCPLPPPWCTKSSIFYYNTYYAVSLKVQEYI